MPAKKQPKQQKRQSTSRPRKCLRLVQVPEFDPANGEAASVGGEPGWLDVNFCVNTFCGNFGLSWQKAEGRGRPYRLKRSYNTLRMICTKCGVDRKVYSNHAVDTMFLHVLKNTLLHEYCPNTRCENYRVNFYEHYLSRYQNPVLNPRKSEYRVKCKGREKKANGRSVRCPNKLTVGTPWRLHGDKGRTGKTPRTRPTGISPITSSS